MKTPSTSPRLLGIIGRSLSHTMSPLMYTTAFRVDGADLRYGVLQSEPAMLPHLVGTLRSPSFRGANVTVPYKQTVMPMLDALSDEASVIGAVNTIVNDGGRLTGYNTDADGVRHALAPLEAELRQAPVLVFGAGGGARAVLYTLARDFSPSSIVIVNRTAETAVTLAREFAALFPAVPFRTAVTAAETAAELERSLLLVNTTTLGMSPDTGSTPLPDGSVIRRNQIVFDIVYNPLRTALLAAAETSGARTVSGLEMLLGQGARSYVLYTQRPFPFDAAREAVLRELQKEGRS